MKKISLILAFFVACIAVKGAINQNNRTDTLSPSTGTITVNGSLEVTGTVTATNITAAINTANAATNLANTAQATANTASNLAASASATAVTASNLAATANTTAGTATNLANAAQATANTASNLAASAQTTANGKLATNGVALVSLLSSNVVMLSAPATLTSSGLPGDIARDSNYLYIAIGTNQWRRTTLAGW